MGNGLLLEGSCGCGQITFSVESDTPYPYRRCYCAICRKANGGGGYAINVMGRTETLNVCGADHLTRYAVENADGIIMEMHFCSICGSQIYVSLPDWPDWVYPRASALDTPLPEPPQTFHVLLGEAASWAEVADGETHHHFQHNTEESIEDWHKRLGIYAVQ